MSSARDEVNALVRQTFQVDFNKAPGDLYSGELFWRDHQPWLAERGYMLRERYKPDWVPSWKGTGRNPERCEDGIRVKFSQLMDARRISDGEMVALKLLLKSSHPYEHEIASYFSSEPLASDPRNHCVRVLETIQVPDDEDMILLVMPFLRKYLDPAFETVGEVVDYVHQIFEGLSFMHEHDVAHRDCNGNNIMMDPKPLYPHLYHPVKVDKALDLKSRARHYSRTERTPKYFLVDFGISSRYKPEDRPPMEPIIQGGDKSVPEHRDPYGSCDPFPTDVYYVGNMIREDLLSTKTGLDFLVPLVKEMTQEDPEQRPTMEQVVARFEDSRKTLRAWKLSERLASRKEFFVFGILRDVLYRGRSLANILVLWHT